MRSLASSLLRVSAVAAALGGLSCGGGGGSPAAPSTPPPASQAPWITIDKVAASGTFAFDGSNGPPVDWHTSYPAGQGTSLRLTAFNAAGAPCLLERLEAPGTGNGRLYLGYPRSAAEWNICLPRVTRVVAELMPNDTATAGLAKDERTVEWGFTAAVPPRTPTPTPDPKTCCRVCTTGKACGDSCISKDKTCNVGPGCACNAWSADALDDLVGLDQ